MSNKLAPQFIQMLKEQKTAETAAKVLLNQNALKQRQALQNMVQNGLHQDYRGDVFSIFNALKEALSNYKDSNAQLFIPDVNENSTGFKGIVGGVEKALTDIQELFLNMYSMLHVQDEENFDVDELCFKLGKDKERFGHVNMDKMILGLTEYKYLPNENRFIINGDKAPTIKELFEMLRNEIIRILIENGINPEHL